MSKRHLLSNILKFSRNRTLVSRTISVLTMEPKVNLKQDPAYVEIQKFYDANGAKINIQQLFKLDTDRFNKFRFVNKLNLMNKIP